MATEKIYGKEAGISRVIVLVDRGGRLKLIEGDRPSEGDRVRLKRTGEEGCIVHVFATYPFRGDVVVHVGERRALCSEDEIEKTNALGFSVKRLLTLFLALEPVPSSSQHLGGHLCLEVL